jgi:hypothetical protein
MSTPETVTLSSPITRTVSDSSGIVLSYLIPNTSDLEQAVLLTSGITRTVVLDNLLTLEEAEA